MRLKNRQRTLEIWPTLLVTKIYYYLGGYNEVLYLVLSASPIAYGSGEYVDTVMCESASTQDYWLTPNHMYMSLYPPP
jgi:hypothetical protein